MYGGFFLGSIWDPYGNTKNLPVAVVNNDNGATLKGKKIAVGNELVDTLKHEDSFEWHFVSEDEADKGLDDGSYYMKIVIPENASENVTTITSDTPSKTTIAYTTTPSRNYIASLLTNQAAQTIAQNVSSKITTSYAQAILDQIGELKTGVGTDARLQLC
jgi:putative membrane protein